MLEESLQHVEHLVDRLTPGGSTLMHMLRNMTSGVHILLAVVPSLYATTAPAAAAAASRSALRVITIIPTRAHRHRHHLTPSAHMEARSLDRRARPPRSAPLIAVLLQRGLRDQLGTPASQRQIILDIIAKGGGLKKHAAARELNLFYGASHA